MEKATESPLRQYQVATLGSKRNIMTSNRLVFLGYFPIFLFYVIRYPQVRKIAIYIMPYFKSYIPLPKVLLERLTRISDV